MTTPQSPEPFPSAPGSPEGAQPDSAQWGAPGPAAGVPAAGWEAQPDSPPSDNRTRKLLFAGAAGAVVGALVVGILWAASSFVGQSQDGAAEDAAAACGVFERVPSDWKPETVTEANTYRLGAGIALAQAAGKADQQYVTLATQAQQVQQAVVTFQVGRIAQLVVDVRNTCDDL
ncbi:hypothetical protein [Actinoplanes solisilvae]|uniref:hypothetical protein n=1 Tax=Actinoplanes solisilvae TaxID=2486853 RepID=UPI000FD9CC65|nr:hypothetical protein [Actinoplanes solisilvae]